MCLSSTWKRALNSSWWAQSFGLWCSSWCTTWSSPLSCTSVKSHGQAPPTGIKWIQRRNCGTPHICLQSSMLLSAHLGQHIASFMLMDNRAPTGSTQENTATKCSISRNTCIFSPLDTSFMISYSAFLLLKTMDWCFKLTCIMSSWSLATWEEFTWAALSVCFPNWLGSPKVLLPSWISGRF